MKKKVISFAKIFIYLKYYYFSQHDEVKMFKPFNNIE
jgi:hypothetical protein